MPDVVGNMDTNEFADLLAEALSVALEPYLRQLKEVSDTVKEVQDVVLASEKEADEKEVAFEALQARLSKTEEALREAHKQLKETENSVKELQGDMPKAAQAYVASQAKDNLKDEETIKAMGPKSDPMSDFITNFVSKTA